VSHHLFGLHHVRDDVRDPLWWDLGFLAAGAILVGAGILCWRTGPVDIATAAARSNEPDRAGP